MALGNKIIALKPQGAGISFGLKLGITTPKGQCLKQGAGPMKSTLLILIKNIQIEIGF